MNKESRGSVRVEQGAKRVRVYLAGRLVADTRRPFLVWEIPYFPTYYLPLGGRAGRARAHRQHRALAEPGRGRDLRRPGEGRDRGRAPPRRYPDSPLESLRDLVRLNWAAMDEWLEEDEPVYTHPRDPYTRVDILASSRHVRVEIDGVTVADSRPAAHPVRDSPAAAVLPAAARRPHRAALPSDTTSHCPYKGTAGYWSVDAGHGVHPDLVWIYRTPLPESQKVAGLACFYNEKVDLYLDGELQDRPRTHFS